MALTRSSNKRQARLTFQPLPSSSLQSSQLSKAVRHRAAAVSFQGASPTSKIALDVESSSHLPSQRLTPRKREFEDKVTGLLTPHPTSDVSEADAAGIFGRATAARCPESRTLVEGNIENSYEDSDDSQGYLNLPSKRQCTRRNTVVISDEDSVSSDDSRTKSRAQPRFPKTHLTAQTEDLDENDVDDVRSPINRRKRICPQDVTGTLGDDEDEVRSPTSRKRRQCLSTSSQGSDDEPNEQRELAEDVDDLEGNVLLETRTRKSHASEWRMNHKNQLEVLKARREAIRRGEAIPSSDPAPSDEEEEDFSDPFAANDDDEDFLTNDGESDVDQDHVQSLLPLHSIASPEEAFEMVVEWLVYKKLDPNFDAGAEKYSIALRKLDDQASTFGASKFSSSAWRADFYRALNARPFLAEKRTGILYSDTCQACGRSSHPATWHIRFHGPVYRRDTLEAIDDKDEDASSCNTEGGNEIVDEGCQFLLGKDCRANAVYAHSFKHWRFHLNSSIIEYLRNEGHLEPEKLALREEWSNQRRATFAETTLEAMKADQYMDQLWVGFRDAIEQAEDGRTGSGHRFINE